jgi:general stress protein 26
MMSNTPADLTIANRARVDRLLTAARDTMARVAYCWAATPSEDGGVNVRVVGPIPGVPGEEDLTIWIVTSGGSRKAADIRRAGRLTLGYQHHSYGAPDDYVVLIGRAALVEDRTEIRDRWIESWRPFFPDGPDDPDVIFIRLNVDRIELCMRDVSPEPFGSRYSAIERGDDRFWKIASD